MLNSISYNIPLNSSFQLLFHSRFSFLSSYFPFLAFSIFTLGFSFFFYIFSFFLFLFLFSSTALCLALENNASESCFQFFILLTLIYSPKHVKHIGKAHKYNHTKQATGCFWGNKPYWALYHKHVCYNSSQLIKILSLKFMKLPKINTETETIFDLLILSFLLYYMTLPYSFN